MVSDNDFKVQATISYYRKMVNEVKKIHTLSSKNTSIDRTDYLNVIGAVLQFLWFKQYPDRMANSLPTQIHNLLDEIELPNDILDSVRKIIETKETVKKEIGNITYHDITDLFIKPILQLLWKSIKSSDDFPTDMKLITDDLFEAGAISETDVIDILGEDSCRDDLCEFVIRNSLNIFWLISNKSCGVRNIPKDVLISPNNIQPIVIEHVKNIIKNLRPKYTVQVDKELNKWFSQVVTEYKDTIIETEKNLARIRELNAEKRFQKTLNKVKTEVFANLFDEVMKIE